MKKTLLLFFVLLSATIIFAQQDNRIRYSVITGDVRANEMEQHLMKIEQEKHPNLAEAINKLRTAYNELQNAPDDFGGHKAQAIADTKAAIISLRKALYYRIYADESGH